MLSDTSVENLIASYMECLGSIGISLPETLRELADIITESLLKGGKLVIITDPESQHLAEQLVYLLANGHHIERPVLPAINFNNLHSANAHIDNNKLLEDILAEQDTLITIARDSTNIQTPIQAFNTQTICITDNTFEGNEAPTISINSNSRDQWFIALCFICNYLALTIESNLFGNPE